LDAAAVCHEPGWSVLRSVKRLLNDAGPRTEVDLAGRSYQLADLLTSFLAQLKSDLQYRSNAGLGPGQRVEAAISVPANASSSQRFLTLDAFTKAGFEVVGGGTFDASLLKMTGRLNEVVTSEGIRRLGGDDFDDAILNLVLKGSKLHKVDAATLSSCSGDASFARKPSGPKHAVYW
jgi:molecular chaperone DnaK